MKPLKIVFSFFIGIIFFISNAMGQANPFINVLVQNTGQVNLGNSVYIQVTVGNTGPTSPIAVNKLRTTVTVPIAYGNLRPHAEQLPNLPAGWTITSTYTTGAAITICNGSDAIPAGVSRTFLLKLQGNAITPTNQTVLGQLAFSSGALCTGPAGGSIAGDNPSDNSSTSTVQVVPANQCLLTSLLAFPTATAIPCFGGTTTISANSGMASDVEYSLNGGAFQPSFIFTNVLAGTYSVVARRISDNACTITSNSVNITQPASALSATATATSVTTPGGNDGTVTANPAGGTPGYTYLWSPGGQTTQIATGLAPGPYSVLITDANGCTTTANANVNDVIVTPLLLVDFNVKLANCKPLLKWISENELNTDRFEIERSSATNLTWTLVGNVFANVNTTTKSNYSFTDISVPETSEKIFYRLKIIDKDGSFKYSKVISVIPNCKTTQAYVLPNPIKNGKLHINITGAVGLTEASLLSLSGQLIKHSKIVNGSNYLNVSSIASGVYILKIKENNGFEDKIKVFIEN